MAIGFTVNSKEKLENLINACREYFEKYHFYRVDFKNMGGTLTPTQNNSLHLYFRLVAKALSEAGFSHNIDVSSNTAFDCEVKTIEIPYTEENVKSMWSAFQLSMIEVAKTSQAPRLKVGEVYDVFSLWIGERFGIHVPWPSKDASQ